ncbi:MAG: hypothetical protein QXH26_01825 [Candidatus Hadarchaeales archaeon]
MKSYRAMKEYFDRQERVAREAEKLSRAVVRACSKGIMRLHAGKGAGTLLLQAKRILQKLEGICENPQSLVVAQQEFGEFFVLNSILNQNRIPEPEEVGIPYYPYLMGLAEVGGELRRAMLDSLRKGELEKAERLLQHMERVFEFLCRFDHPESILPGLRRKRDIYRRILEQSRGDFILAGRGRNV